MRPLYTVCRQGCRCQAGVSSLRRQQRRRREPLQMAGAAVSLWRVQQRQQLEQQQGSALHDGCLEAHLRRMRCLQLP